MASLRSCLADVRSMLLLRLSSCCANDLVSVYCRCTVGERGGQRATSGWERPKPKATTAHSSHSPRQVDQYHFGGALSEKFAGTEFDEHKLIPESLGKGRHHPLSAGAWPFSGHSPSSSWRGLWAPACSSSSCPARSWEDGGHRATRG